jgi:tryptophan synthase beta chain
VAETLIQPLVALEEAYGRYRDDPEFLAELGREFHYYVGRPSPRALVQALRRGPHLPESRGLEPHRGPKIDNTVNQDLLAARMGKRRIIAETRAGQHGVATATMAARMGMAC